MVQTGQTRKKPTENYRRKLRVFSRSARMRPISHTPRSRTRHARRPPARTCRRGARTRAPTSTCICRCSRSSFSTAGAPRRATSSSAPNKRLSSQHLPENTQKERRRWTYDIGRRVVALVLQLAVDLVIVEPVDAARSQPDGVAVQVVRLVPPAGRSAFTGCVTKQRARVAGESHQPVG